MENAQKVYLVKYIEAFEISEVIAYFDNRDKAEEFLNRFKTSAESCEIEEYPLNPKYIINKQADPLLITLGKNDDEPIDIINHDYLGEAEEAEREEYKFEFRQDGFKDVINIMLFASSEDEAVDRAIKKRDEIIASGEWERERNKALKSIS